MSKAKIKFTYADYRSLPEVEGRRYELWEGELVMVPSPNLKHQLVVGNLFETLRYRVEKGGLGWVLLSPLDVVLSDEIVLQPDIVVVLREHVGILDEAGIKGAPDLVVEVISPRTAERDHHYKNTLYARHGVREYWIVDPAERTVEVYMLGERGFEPVGRYRGEETLKSSLLPGLEIPLREIFAELR